MQNTLLERAERSAAVGQTTEENGKEEEGAKGV
jgi:hypothetical protein